MSARNECGADRIIVDSTSIAHMNKSDWLRQECLLSYYKKIFWSALAKRIPVCQNLTDQLIEFSYYRQNIRSNVDNLSTTQNAFVSELDLFEACENKIKNAK